MKSKITKQPEPVDSFPCLMLSRVTGKIYMMFSEYEGVCVHSNGESQFSLGARVNTLVWRNMEPFNGAVTISNQEIEDE